MVILQVTTANEAYEAIDLSILGLLFGTMIVSVYLEKADAFKCLGWLLSWNSRGAKDLICRICLTAAISSAFFTNYTTCMVLTEFVLKFARQYNLPPHPFLLALASSANIGSAASPIGNPQNLIIATRSNISFADFLIGMLPATLVGVLVNALILLCMYWNLLSTSQDEEDKVGEVVAEEDVNVQSSSLSATVNSSHEHVAPLLDPGGALEATMRWKIILWKLCILRHCWNADLFAHGSQHVLDCNCCCACTCGMLPCALNYYLELTCLRTTVVMVPLFDPGGALEATMRWKMILWKFCAFSVSVGMLISLLTGHNMSWTAIAAALALVVIDFRDAQPCLEKVIC
ncbi:putative transporter arsB [Morella rubra]|uniref:Putative transporter arsB n=1 Tax=Morella rubra TaxID=262757 RepID=A0A6A1UWR0_9ROSI|nr:putative transporter arsB [Morella rubra]